MENQIIVGVPGPWETRPELMQALADTRGGEYLFAGGVFMETATKQSCLFDWYEPDGRLREAFELAAPDTFSVEVLDAIEAHRATVYLIFPEPGYEAARTATRFAAALLDAGGFAVKVETAGVAHTREHWLARAGSENPLDIYALFVQLIGSDDRYYSCGMQNFGLPDAAAPATLDVREGSELLNVFNFYQLVEAPELHEGETFSPDPDSPRWRLAREPYPDDYDPSETLYNPYGLWALRPADPPAPPRRRWTFRA